MTDMYFPTRSSMRRSTFDQSTTSVNITQPQQRGEFGHVGNGYGDGVSRLQRKPFLRGSTMSMVASPAAAPGIISNNLGYYNNNYSDAISVKSVQIGADGGTIKNKRSTSSARRKSRPSCNYNSIQIICRDDDRDPLLSSLMSSPSKRSLSARSARSNSVASKAVPRGVGGGGAIDAENVSQTTMLVCASEESWLTPEEIAG